jgi:hypothetical protein
MSMRIRPDTLRSEIEQVVSILSSWQDRLAQGVPGDEAPANDLNAEIFQFQLRGEVQLAAERLMALVEVLEV